MVAETCNLTGAKQDAESLRQVFGSFLSIPGLLTGARNAQTHQYRDTCGFGCAGSGTTRDDASMLCSRTYKGGSVAKAAISGIVQDLRRFEEA